MIEPVSAVEINDTIEVSNPSHYTLYVITVFGPLSTWQVSRRFSEFVELHSKLSDIEQPPFPLPPKAVMNFSPDLVNERKLELTKYLEGILYSDDPILRSSNVWSLFLEIPDKEIVFQKHVMKPEKDVDLENTKRRQMELRKVNQNWFQKKYFVSTLIEQDIEFACFQFDSEKLVVGTEDGKIRIYGLGTGICHRMFEGHTDCVSCLQFDDNIIVSGSADKSAIAWDLFNGKILFRVKHLDTITCLQFDENYIITGSKDQTVKVWNVDSGKLLYTLNGHTESITCLQVVNNILVKLILCDLRKKLLQVVKLGFRIASLHFDGENIMLGHPNGFLSVVDTRGKLVKQARLHNNEGIIGVQFDLDRVVTISNSLIKLWSRDNFSFLYEIAETDLSQMQFNDNYLGTCSSKQINVYDFSHYGEE
ncbi:hypothetical protein HK103_005051 [Boothiomyces macroporosus]|uniref:PX domain-containing protein n=1 Tax=Boothiomyces macroporosus TaxID=261099 RepID=A0AAD5Y5G0_9FUNG|nr:hypothetical protein HK103_005051 [Boothiomyces macroporosus]